MEKIQGLRRAKNEIFSYLRAFSKKKPVSQKKFVIFSQGRTGSNLVRTLLHSHPDVVCQGEIFLRSHVKVLFPKLFLTGQRAKYPENIVYGFQLKPTQLDFHQIDAKQFLSDFHEDGWKIIYLKRNNLFRQKISAMIAVNKKQWMYHSQSDSKSEPLKLHVEGDGLLKDLEKRERDYLREQKILEQLPYLEIVYENDLLSATQHQKTADKIFDYLGIPSATVETKLVKTPHEISDVIQNYEEIAELLSKTKYAHFLERECLNK